MKRKGCDTRVMRKIKVKRKKKRLAVGMPGKEKGAERKKRNVVSEPC